MSDSPRVFGRKEWVALPDIGVPAIKAKVDTGARTSALHANDITALGPPHQPMVRFTVYPLPLRPDISVVCTVPIVAQREVTSSNGDKERRYIVKTHLRVGDLEWPIEIGLTNRESMSHRMLIGRQAIPKDFMVDPATSYHQPKLGSRAYKISTR